MKAFDLFMVLLQIVLIVLKVTGVINLTWTMTLLPLIFAFCMNIIWALILIVIIVIGLVLK